MGGCVIDIKDAWLYRELWNIEIGDIILNVLKELELDTLERCTANGPIILYAFDIDTVKNLRTKCNLPVVQLVNNYA